MKLSLRAIQPKRTIDFQGELTLENLKALYPVVWEVKEESAKDSYRTIEFSCFYSGVKVTIFEFESGLDKISYNVLQCETDNFTTYQSVSKNSGKLSDLETTVKFIRSYQKVLEDFPSPENVLANLTTDDRFTAGVSFALHSREIKATYTICLPEYSQIIETVSTSIKRICKRFDLNAIIAEAEKIAEKKRITDDYQQALKSVEEKAAIVKAARVENYSNDSARFSVSIPVDRFADFQAFLETL
jgi:hypothetical protein